MAVALVWPNRTPLWTLRARFPNLRSTNTEGELVGDCPVPHGGNLQAVFIARSFDNGWAISPCDMGCMPKDIYEGAAQLDARQPGEDDAAPSAPPGWGFQTATVFLALTFPPPRWLYLDLVPAESVTVVMAAPNAGKTFFGLEVVAQVAVKAAQQGTHVCIVEEEGTGAAFQWRLSRALASVGGGNPDLIKVTWNTGRSLRNKADLASLARDCKGADLIMLDSLSALAGGINENDSEEMAAIAEAIHVLKTLTGAAVMVLHHMTKAAWKEGETPRLEHMRGHGALPGRADAVLALVPLESDETAVNFELHCVKQRDGSKPKARTFSVAMKGPAATITMSDKGDPIRRATVSQELRAEVLARLPASTAKPISKNFLCSLIDRRRADIYRVVDLLVASAEAVEITAGRYTKSANVFPRPGTLLRGNGPEQVED